MRSFVAHPGVEYPLYGLATLTAWGAERDAFDIEKAYTITVYRVYQNYDPDGYPVLSQTVRSCGSWRWDAGPEGYITGELILRVVGGSVHIDAQELCRGCRGIADVPWGSRHTEGCLIPLAIAAAEASR